MDYKDKMETFLLLKKEKSKSEHKALQPNEFFASQAGVCSRKLWYEKKGYASEPEVKLLGIFEIGNILHEYVQKNIMSDNKHEIEYPIQIKEGDIVIRARIDALSDKEVIEIKSATSFKDEITTPKPLNIMQTNLYLSKFPKHTGKLVYISKLNLLITEFDIEFDKELYDITISKFFKCYEHLLIDELPELERSDQCKYCEFAHTKCINNEK